MYSKKGPPAVFELIEIEKPVPKDDEVLVKVHATSVDSWDWEMLSMGPSMVPLGKRHDPRYKILGADIAGVVEAVGSDIKRFKPGDEVFGDLSKSGWGGYAEYTCAWEDALALKPESLTFEQAASIPQAGQMAIQGMRDIREILPGEKVLINGAGGGVGTFAVQIAKSYGTEVTGVDSGAKLDLLRSLGADHVIDYRKENHTKTGQRYDLILDVKGNRSLTAYRRALRPGGAFVLVGGKWRLIFKVLVIGPVITRLTGKAIKMIYLHQNKERDSLIDLVESGKVKPIIDRRYPLSEVGEAIQYIEEGHVQGKIIITMDGVN